MHEEDITFVLMLEAAMPLIRENLTEEEWAAFSAGLRALAPQAAGPDIRLTALTEQIRDVARPYAYVRGILGERGAPMIPPAPAPQKAPVSVPDVAQRLYGLLNDPDGAAQRRGEPAASQVSQGQSAEREQTGAGHAPHRRDA